MKPKVFISVGSAATTVQAQASDAIFRSLEIAGLSPRQVDKNEWIAEQPLRGIKKVIDQCHGVVIIAFERYKFPTGAERRKDGQMKSLNDVQMPTIWNHIEAAMGYSRGLPLLVIAEKGLLDDGLLAGEYDWRVYWTEFTPEALRSDSFIGYVEAWKSLVMEQAKVMETVITRPAPDISKMSLKELRDHLTLPQLWAALSALFGCLAGTAAIAFRAGAGKWPWQ